VTVRLHLPLAEAGRSDDLNKSIDYCAVQRVVRSIMEGPPRKLIESLAEAIAAELLRQFSTVQAVEVEIAKPEPPVDFEFDGVSISLRRERK
ncbi:MAG: dihydroneopterin aldolase, partial [Verrucomicrobiota bacterium]|nr:dihydroneopterin aldolase [Verrucomicrobiota bacterium]